MPFATWWRGDPVPALPPLPSLTVRRSLNRALINSMTGLTRPAIEGRIKADNAFFVALLDREPAAYGWAALREGRIDELAFRFAVPPGNAYLWDFETLPAWRGRGIYPQLLQGITALLNGVDRFWIGYEGHNAASARGIQKAGFAVVGDLMIEDGRVTGFEMVGTRGADDARIAAARSILQSLADDAPAAADGPAAAPDAPAATDPGGAP
jgi:GNAT superfamily N-acetyltransferase